MLNNVLNLFFPPICLACDALLIDNERTICTSCRHDLPLANFTDFEYNEVTKRLYGRVLLKYATALVWFSKKGMVQHLMHNLKYKGQEEIGKFMGSWLGYDLHNTPFASVDIVIPVPLHARRLRERGYNQVALFGRELASALHVEYNDHILVKTKATKTQVFKGRLMRWNSDDSLFSITDYNSLKHKHILLVDDIITTGATLESCAQALSKIEGITISVATMAIAE